MQTRKRSAIEGRNHRGERNPNWRGGKIKRICLHCGKDFSVKQYTIKEGGGNYCSQSCSRSSRTGDKSSNWRGGGILKKCKICHKEFTVKKSEPHKGKFCSRKCHGKWKSDNNIGKNNPSWKGGITPERQVFLKSDEWKRAASLVWKRDKAQCQNCGKKQIYKEKSFEIHHIVSFKIKRLRADTNNLVLLCNPCHHFVHSKKNTDRKFIKDVTIENP